jgi:hypothetical protein
MSTYVLKNNEQTGPYEDAAIRSGLASGAFSYDDHAWREGMAEWQPLSTLYPTPPSTPRTPPAPAANRKPALTCQTCGQGALVKRKKYRMSVPVVLIGYILLVPCVIGMLVGVMLLFAIGSAGTAVSADADKETRTRLEAQAIPEPIIQKVISFKPITADDRSILTPEQKSLVDEERLSLSGSKVGAGAGAVISGGLSIFFIICCFVGGLLGWLLVMKKKVLQCNQCSAIVAAS